MENDKEVIAITNVEEREVEEKPKSYTIHIDFKFTPSSSFEVVKFDPKCLLYQEKVLPQKVPVEGVAIESLKTDVSLQEILAKARQGGSFGDLLPDMTWEPGRVKRERLEEQLEEARGLQAFVEQRVSRVERCLTSYHTMEEAGKRFKVALDERRGLVVATKEVEERLRTMQEAVGIF